MENAVDALKIAFAVFVFIIALSLTMYMFSRARETADIVLHSSDVTEYMQYEEITSDTAGNRIVGIESIIPTLYKYTKENYTVVFRNANGSFMKLYETKAPGTNNFDWKSKYYPIGENSKSICSFDVNEETTRQEPWTGNPQETKKMLDTFINGGKITYNYSNNSYEVDFGRGFLQEHKNDKFIESLGEYTYNEKDTDEGNSDNLTKNKKKRVIIYTLQN